MAPWPRHVGVIKLGPEQTKSLRHVELPTDAVEWAPSCFVKLLSLTLKGKKGTPEGPEGLTGDLLVGIIQASPELRELKLQDIDMEAAVPCPSITLLDLEFISLEGCSADLTEFILKLVQAPACAKVNLTLSPLQVVNISAVFGSCLRLLRGTLLKTHQGIRKSNISVNGDRVFRWTSPGFDADGTTSRGFRIAVIPVWQVCFQPCIEAVDQVFRNEISVELFLLCEPGYAERILRLIPPMESVKKVTLGSLLYSSEISNALRYLGEPAPPFPCLHEVKIATKRRDRDKPQEIYDSKFSVRRIPDTEH
ncbi:hypothetical protein FRB90_012725 [Tulasnella sp. 427]|nr:hypothetical protein FRB90_012725 [Tulasnella sp. 427]